MTQEQYLWDSVAERLLKDYELISSVKPDPEVAGTQYQDSFRKFLKPWLPARVEVFNGIIASRGATTGQRDVVFFDSHNCPTFKESTDSTNILPIEGVLGCIEINGSEITKDKLHKDMDKMSQVKTAVHSSVPHTYIGLGEVNSDKPNFTIYRQAAIRGGKFSYVFARDSQVALNTLAGHVLEKNLELGVDGSTDAVFILNRGFIFHGNPDGSNVVRLQGSPLYFVECEPKIVLIRMIAMILQNLRLGEVGRIPDLEEYFDKSSEHPRSDLLSKRQVVDNPTYHVQSSNAINVS